MNDNLPLSAGVKDLIDRKKQLQDELFILRQNQDLKKLKKKQEKEEHEARQKISPEVIKIEEELKDLEGKIIEKTQDQRSDQ